MIDVHKIFIQKPSRYGLRGDPFLWNELCIELSKEKIETLEDFTSKLKNSFKYLVSKGVPSENGKIIKMPEYPKEGLSGGLISNTWWINEGIPALLNLCEHAIIENYSPIDDLSITFRQGGMREFAETGRYPEKLKFYSSILGRIWTHRVNGDAKFGKVTTKGKVIFRYKFKKYSSEVIVIYGKEVTVKMYCISELSD